jgi:hypothetical protein
MPGSGSRSHLSTYMENMQLFNNRFNRGLRGPGYPMGSAQHHNQSTLHNESTITACFEVIGSAQEGAITNVYGPNHHQDKDAFLQQLELIKTLTATPNWIIGGDFNMILTLEEKTGGTKKLEQDSGKFRTLIDNLKLVDMETSNGTFTWSNRRSGNQHIACRLDRFLVTEELLESGSCLDSLILPTAGSDHWPIALQLNLNDPPRYKPFRFEKFWLQHPDFQRLAKSWWAQAEIDHGSKMYKLQQRSKTSNKG